MEKINIFDCIEESERKILKLDSKYDEIMNIPTLNHVELFDKMNGSWDSYLGILGSFGPCLEAILRGSKNIVTFDKNPLNILHSHLLIAAILKLEYDDFIKFISYSEEESFYSKYYFDKIKDELPQNAKNYWGYMISEYKENSKFLSLFCNPCVLEEENYTEALKQLLVNNNFYQKQNFYVLKRKLKEIKLQFLLEEFDKIPQVLNNQRFDKLYLSCLNFYIKEKNGYNYFEQLKQFLPLLKPNGVAECAYIYHRYRDKEEYDTDIFSKAIPLKKVRIRSINTSEKFYDISYIYQKNQGN